MLQHEKLEQYDQSFTNLLSLLQKLPSTELNDKTETAEVEISEKNIDELIGIYEEKVKNSMYGNENDYLYRNKIMDNSVNWLVKNLQDSLSETKSKMDDWKNDEQRYLNSLGLSMKHINN